LDVFDVVEELPGCTFEIPFDAEAAFAENRDNLYEHAEKMWHKPEPSVRKASMHEKLWQIVRRLNTDYEPFGKAEREGPDCSCGCRHFIKLLATWGTNGVFVVTRNRHGPGC
jgi:hypothetical protein